LLTDVLKELIGTIFKDQTLFDPSRCDR